MGKGGGRRKGRAGTEVEETERGGRGGGHTWGEGAKAVITSEVKVRPLCLALHLPVAHQFTAHLEPDPIVLPEAQQHLSCAGSPAGRGRRAAAAAALGCQVPLRVHDQGAEGRAEPQA